MESQIVMSQFHLLFSGEISEEFETNIVRSNFKNHFQLSELQVEHYFSGHEVIIQSDLTQLEALELAMQIDRLGGVSYLIPAENKIVLDDGVIIDRRKKHRRKIRRRNCYRAGINSDRRMLFDRRHKI